MPETGTIKLFDPIKGFGFIRPEQGRELFFHISDCAEDLYQFSPGETVKFEQEGKGKSRRAIKIERIKTESQ